MENIETKDCCAPPDTAFCMLTNSDSVSFLVFSGRDQSMKAYKTHLLNLLFVEYLI